MSKFIIFVLGMILFNSQTPPPDLSAEENQVKRLLILYIDSNTMAWNATGTLIATAEFGTLRMWDAQTLEQRYSVEHGPGLNNILFNDAGDLFLTWSYSAIRTWETETGRLLGTLESPGNFKGVTWHGDRVLYWIGGTINLWDGLSPEKITGLVIPNESFGRFRAGVSWNQARTRFLTWNPISSEIPIVRMWQVNDELDSITQLMTLPHEDEWLDGAAWSPDETMIASWSKNRVKIWDAATGEPLYILNTDSYLTDARWSPNSHYILIKDIRENQARIWDVITGEEVLTIPGTDAMWDTSGDRLLVGRQTVELLAVPTGDKLAEFGPDLGLGTAQWNPDGIRLLVDTAFGVQVWIIPSQDQCVLHALAPANLRPQPSTDAERADVLPPHRLVFVTDQTLDVDNFIWWQLDTGLWVRSDVVEETGRCF